MCCSLDPHPPQNQEENADKKNKLSGRSYHSAWQQCWTKGDGLNVLLLKAIQELWKYKNTDKGPKNLAHVPISCYTNYLQSDTQSSTACGSTDGVFLNTLLWNPKAEKLKFLLTRKSTHLQQFYLMQSSLRYLEFKLKFNTSDYNSCMVILWLKAM